MTKLRRIIVLTPELILIGSVLVLGIFIVFYDEESFLNCYTLSKTEEGFETLEELEQKYPNYKQNEDQWGILFNMADWFKYSIYLGFAISLFHLVIVLIIILFCQYLKNALIFYFQVASFIL